MTGLNMTLQTHPRTLYDTGQSRLRPGWPAPMDHPASRRRGLETTLDLVQLAKGGDQAALERLLARCLPPLRRWASGRLPRWTRDLMDTDDLVQETVFRAVKRIESFEPRHEGALQAYLRQAIVNRIRDEVRRSVRSPAPAELDENESDRSASPLDE